ncbi:methionine adenosyltransferase [Estrella lausannensis]|uniref:methionine adenosyltransferase n=1 Tax=Estrella lausannensis TaxID=483423 RepID=UPI003B830EE3
MDMAHYLFTSESVAAGHPDKVADTISDSILDAYLKEDPNSRVACETLVTTGLVVLAGEISSKAHIDHRKVVREAIRDIGYDDPSLGFDYQSCGILTTISEQSTDIAAGVDEAEGKEMGAGDQGIMFGYACDETKELMPLPIMLAHSIVRELRALRESKDLDYLRPDAKSQITVEYDRNDRPVRLNSVVISTQHSPKVKQETLVHDMTALVHQLAPHGFIDENTLFYINPTGRFVIGGPAGDTGLTGRKIIVDTYGGMGRHGGGAFSGKDPTKVDRSASYAARWVAKNIVGSGLARRCEVQISYAIGVAYPLSIKVNTFGTGQVPESLLAHVIPLVFDLSPKGIIESLNLRRPVYKATASGGHFGREEEGFTWERLDKVEKIKEAIRQAAYTTEG